MLDSEYGFAVLGGTLIALSTSFNLLMKGRITGMSGIYFGVITNDPKTAHWKTLFIMVTFMTSIVFWYSAGFEQPSEKYPNFFDHPAILNNDLNKGGFFLAGLLVGLGTKLGNGCTSGHGVCGLPRLSIRSWVYVPIFVVCAFIVATFRNYVPFLNNNDINYWRRDYDAIMDSSLLITIWAFIFYGFYYVGKPSWAVFKEIVITSITAFLFAMGLIISGMVKRSKILGFLVLNENWDVCLLLVLCAAVGVNFLTFHYIVRIKKQTLFGEKLEIPMNNKIDKKLVLGGVLFGMGWGLGGLCPGPGFVLFPFLTPHISLYWFFGLTLGQYLIKFYDMWVETHKTSDSSSEVKPKN